MSSTAQHNILQALAQLAEEYISEYIMSKHIT